MNPKEMLRFCLEKGLLVDEDILNFFSALNDAEASKMIIEKIGQKTQKRVITKKLFSENKDQLSKILLELPKESQQTIENLKIKLGLSIEISKEIKALEKNEVDVKPRMQEHIGVKVVSAFSNTSKKIEVKDFVTYFRNRFIEMRKILQDRNELSNLVSINKIFGNRQGISLIGIVLSKRTTKNGNLLFEIEDLSGKILALVNQNKPELYEKADQIALDSVVGFKCSGNREIIYVNDVIFPDSILQERKKSPKEEYVLFTGDLHVGVKEKFLEQNFLRFIDYLNGKLPNTPEANKIKYLFVVGDLIAGVGEYPGQEKDLDLPDVEVQYQKVAELFGKIRKDIKIIVCPGNHDALRIMEPQPQLDEKYAWPIYNLKNVILTTNPSQVNIGAVPENNFPGFDVLMYHGASFHFYSNNVNYLMKEKAAHKPEMIMSYLLKNRHLAPTHASVQYFPSPDDALMIKKVPDILFSGHTHKGAVSYYNNILVISSSCWEKKTPYQEKMGNEPDFCKVPMLNLKTRAIKILDFE